MGFAFRTSTRQRSAGCLLEVSKQSHENVGQAAEEASLLERLRSIGLALNPTDPRMIAQGERQLREWIDQRARAAGLQTITTTTEKMGLVGELAERITGTLPAPTESETRTFHEALRAYRTNVKKTGKRLDDGELAPSPKTTSIGAAGWRTPRPILRSGSWISLS